MFSLSRKNNLAILLMKMRKNFPSYDFFPPTWVLPADSTELRYQISQKQCRVLIVKPEASCQGRGIFLARRIQDIPPMESFVVQKYIEKPFLIDGLKFDLRLYVLVAGVDPLRVYFYKEGIARFATESYEPPNGKNLGNVKTYKIIQVCQHLTNYAINMNNPKFIFNKEATQTDIGHKRSFSSILSHL
jgi:tubulin polyglutamylase TTLL6/13